MENFTFEFLPHYASNFVRNADFSLYEVRWNSYGRWGYFECQINRPSAVRFIREVDKPGIKHILLEDMHISDNSGNWAEKKLALYERFQGQPLNKLPDNLSFHPEEWLLMRLNFSFTIEERQQIATMFNFSFSDKMDANLIKSFLQGCSFDKYKDHFALK